MTFISNMKITNLTLKAMIISAIIYILINVIFTTLVIVISSSYSFAEDRSRKEYWINRYGLMRENNLSVRAHEVFGRVLSASDRRVGLEPALYIINYDGSPWAQSLADGSVILSRKGLEFCYKNMAYEKGDSWLAFVLGHELAHHFNGDFWHYKFFRTREDDNNSTVSFQDLEDLSRNPDMLLAKEIQADQYGIIYSTLAGYGSDEIVSRDGNFFLEWTEQELASGRITDFMRTINQKRKQAVALRLKEVSERMALFEIGVINYYLGRYDEGLMLFKRFASYFPGREVYANIGVVYLRMAYEKFLSSRTADSFPFELSFGVDTKSRAENINVSRGFTEDKYREYKNLLALAVENLTKAAEYDSSYKEAKNSLGCAYIIWNKYYEAVAVLEETSRDHPEDVKIQNNLAVAYMLLANDIGSLSLTEKAKRILAAARDQSDIAEANWSALMRLENSEGSFQKRIRPYQEQYSEYFIEFVSKRDFVTGASISSKNNLRTIEELSDNGKISVKVLEAPGKGVFLFADNNRIRIILYKHPQGIKANLKGGESRDILISQRGRNGVMVLRNNEMDYFEF